MTDVKFQVFIYFSAGVQFLDFGCDEHRARAIFKELKDAGVRARLMKTTSTRVLESL